MNANTASFSRIRSLFWPIHDHEHKKFLPMLVLFFLITFNYHLLRIAKDALIITAPQSGAEALPFLKFWAVLPTAVLMTFLYTRLSNRFNPEVIFYVMTSSFLAFFTLFVLVLYPYQESLCAHGLADFLESVLPIGLKGFMSIIRYWSFTLFYVMGDAWSNIMVSLLLWGFANHVTSIEESTRFYALFGVGTNSSGILAGKVGMYISSMANMDNQSSWDDTLSLFVILIILVGLASIAIYRWLHVYVFTDYIDKDPALRLKTKRKKKMTLLNSFSHLASSKYLRNLALIVLAYNLIINLTEVVWKSQMKELYPNKRDFTLYMSTVTYYVGLVATFTSYFISGNVIRSCGWKISALATPFIVFITSSAFFYFLYLKELSPGVSDSVILFGMTPLALTVFFGSAQNCLSRAAKYTVFDDTKEIAFIPLSSEEKIKGKAAIDGIGSRLGKSGGSLLLQILLMFLSTPLACFPYIAGIIGLSLLVWTGAIRSLAKDFDQKNKVTPPQKVEVA